jgi:hypothetical protein
LIYLIWLIDILNLRGHLIDRFTLRHFQLIIDNLLLNININILKDVDIVATNDNITIKFLELVEFNVESFRLNVIKYITVVMSK